MTSVKAHFPFIQLETQPPFYSGLRIKGSKLEALIRSTRLEFGRKESLFNLSSIGNFVQLTQIMVVYTMNLQDQSNQALPKHLQWILW